ncbi:MULTISPECIES: YolD-like family protein [Exiguobacterium]|uniref:YolD-like family protein n=1 Tax=Exiguobacterium antarcticum TaxID=132920 RepID=A0ABT6R5K5_9BACL|nr:MULTISPECIES: YolD-like family protein [Exiguobacterium]AFS70597.1 Hypothetical protein Eab7_1481 [Exiguobacterium antarcticum B7]MCT4780028.1 YolD-like family protein [Exiguobacterium soli]MDI3236244.1 YolD-like family protein [Exiguobacterium antarcticum]
MLQSKKRTVRKWRQRTTRHHILQLEHLYQRESASSLPFQKVTLWKTLEEAIRSGRQMTIEYVRHGKSTVLTGTISALLHQREMVEVQTSTGLHQKIRFKELCDIRINT